MAALQDAVSTDAGAVALGALARAIARNAVDVFGPSAVPACDVHGDAAVPAHIGSALAVALNELVMNAVRHAEAHHVSVDIERADSEVTVEISDDGRGLATPEAGGGGLIIARTVIRNELRGRLDLLPRTSGTAVRITVPMPPDQKEERPALSGP
jgi:signal transduction histidine kinase